MKPLSARTTQLEILKTQSSSAVGKMPAKGKRRLVQEPYDTAYRLPPPSPHNSPQKRSRKEPNRGSDVQLVDLTSQQAYADDDLVAIKPEPGAGELNMRQLLPTAEEERKLMEELTTIYEID